MLRFLRGLLFKELILETHFCLTEPIMAMSSHVGEVNDLFVRSRMVLEKSLPT